MGRECLGKEAGAEGKETQSIRLRSIQSAEVEETGMRLLGAQMVPWCLQTGALCYTAAEFTLTWLTTSLFRHVSKSAKHMQKSELRQSRHREKRFCV